MMIESLESLITTVRAAPSCRPTSRTRRPSGPEVHIVLQPDPAPARKIDARLHRHHRVQPAAGPRRSAPSRGASCTSSPSPCPSDARTHSPNPRAAMTSRASASASRPVMPARSARSARSLRRLDQRVDRRAAARRPVAPTTTVRVRSAQYPSTWAPKSSSSHSPARHRRSLVRACGSAERGPDATMVGNGCHSLPRRRRARLQRRADLQLGLPRPDARQHLRQGLLGQLGRRPDRRDFLRRLDRPLSAPPDRWSAPPAPRVRPASRSRVPNRQRLSPRCPEPPTAGASTLPSRSQTLRLIDLHRCRSRPTSAGACAA